MTFTPAVIALFVALAIAITCIAVESSTINRSLRRILVKIDDVIALINSTTNDLAARVQALADSITADGSSTLTAAQEAEVAAIVARLQSIGANPADPVPPVDPVV